MLPVLPKEKQWGCGVGGRLGFLVGSVSKHSNSLSLRRIFFLFQTSKRTRKKKNHLSLFSHLLSAQLEEQHNDEETPMYLNQSGDATTLCVIEGTSQGEVARRITRYLGQSL